MKRIFLTLLAIAVCAAWAMGADVTKQINHIKQAYDQAQKTIAMADDEPMTRNTFSINIDQMYPGSGPHKEKVHFFFTCLDFDENDNGPDGSIMWKSNLYLVRQSYNIGGADFYNEFLYDMETGEPLFALYTFPDKKEFRVYLDKGKVIKTIPGTPPDEHWNIKACMNDFNRLKDIFQLIILQSPLI